MKYLSRHHLEAEFTSGEKEVFDWVGPQLAWTVASLWPHAINGINVMCNGAYIFIPYAQIKRSKYKEEIIGEAVR